MITTKIKFDIGGNEIVNCIAMVLPIGYYWRKRNGQYQSIGIKYAIVFDNKSFDLSCKFDFKRRCFYGCDD